jgi:hypothetical protein
MATIFCQQGVPSITKSFRPTPSYALEANAPILDTRTRRATAPIELCRQFHSLARHVHGLVASPFEFAEIVDYQTVKVIVLS